MKILWTDGSADPNPGPGGWAVIDADEKTVILSGGELNTTNIRMEGTAIREAIKYGLLKDNEVEIRTDSEFWVKTITEWAPVWERNHWKKKSGEIKNLDLVKEIYELYNNHNIHLVWVKAHVGLELNELADLAAASAREHNLKKSKKP